MYNPRTLIEVQPSTELIYSWTIEANDRLFPLFMVGSQFQGLESSWEKNGLIVVILTMTR